MRPGRFVFATASFLLALISGAAAAAQNPFVGTWKVNQEKSQLAGDTMKFGPAEGNAMELIAGGVRYSFRADGGNYATPAGNIAIWRQLSPDSWTTEYRKIDGKLLATSEQLAWYREVRRDAPE